jgi:hypothetical protein
VSALVAKEHGVMAGGLQPPNDEEDAAVVYAPKGGIYFVLEDADLTVGKVGKVSPAPNCVWACWLRAARQLSSNASCP